MSPVRLIHELNSALSTAVGIPLNVLTVWLILRRTNAEMGVYSRLLLQTCVFDLLFLVVQELTQPIFFVDAGGSSIVLNGVLGALGLPLGNGLYLLWFFLFFASVHGLAAQFVFRFLVLCRDRRPTKLLYFALLGAIVCAEATLIGLLAPISYPREPLLQNADVLALLNQGDSQKRWILAVQIQSNNLTNLWFLGYFALNLFCYVVIGVCTAKIRTFMRKNLRGAQNQNKLEIQKQISRTLFLQAVIPCVIVLTMLVDDVVGLFMQGSLQLAVQMEMLVSCPINWLPVLNSLVTMFTVREYRQFILQKLLDKKSSVSPSNTVQQVTQSNVIRAPTSQTVRPMPNVES